MLRTIVLFLFIFSAPGIKAQDIPDELRSFVLKGYDILDFRTGDLNADKKTDAILVLRQPGEDTAMEPEIARPLLLLIRQADGKLQLVKRSDKIVMCRHCGGALGDPYSDLVINGNGFSISFYGGSSWRWTYDYDFIYKPSRKDWYLVKETQSSFQAGEPSSTLKESVIGESELGEISFDHFSSEPVYEDSRWKVIAAKTFFYDSPKLGSKPRKAYLVKGNIATGIRTLKNFVEISFENQQGVFTHGYILKKDLVKQN